MVRIRKKNDDGENRLGALPDSILVDIISRLPTKTAAATAVLSPRWQDLWTQITSIDINSIDFHRSFDTYADMNKVFQKFTSSLIHSFTLRVRSRTFESTWKNDWSDVMNSWVRKICDRKVEKIDIKVVERDFKIMNIVAPPCIFQTPSLVVLELGADFSCFVPSHVTMGGITTSNFNLPNLKKLSLTISPTDCFFWGKLIESCPSLEDLCLIIHRFHRLYTCASASADLSISGKKLEQLNIKAIGNLITAKVIVDAPNLKYLMVDVKSNELKVLLPLLELCPSLEVLVLGSGGSSEFGWITPNDSSPLCLLKHIKRIEIELAMPDYNEEESLLDAIRYFLTTAGVLERLICSFTKNSRGVKANRSRELSFWEKLSKYQRSSPRCHIEFTGLCIKVSTNDENSLSE